MPRQVPFTYSIMFSGIAALGTVSQGVLVEADADFVVQRMRAVFWNDATSGTSIARTPFGLLGDMSPIATYGNTWFNHHQLFVKLSDNTNPWNKVAVPLPLMFDVGQVDRPAITPMRVIRGQTITSDLTNYANVQASGVLLFAGFKELP